MCLWIFIYLKYTRDYLKFNLSRWFFFSVAKSKNYFVTSWFELFPHFHLVLLCLPSSMFIINTYMIIIGCVFGLVTWREAILFHIQLVCSMGNLVWFSWEFWFCFVLFCCLNHCYMIYWLFNIRRSMDFNEEGDGNSEDVCHCQYYHYTHTDINST